MCVVLLTYIADLKQVDAHMAAHAKWLRQGLDAGVIIVAGRRSPRTGGVILFRGAREAVQTVAASDPFVKENIASVEIIEFNVSFASAAFGELLS